MPLKDNNTQAFLELVRAGLWEKEARLLPFGEVDYTEVIRLAEEQAVVGLVTAGLEQLEDVKLAQEDILQFAGHALQIEQRNAAMNSFVSFLINQLRKKGIYVLLIKGQGIAQCYERPKWRTSGDIDLFFDKDNYYRAKEYLSNYATCLEEENMYLHLGMTVDGWPVELHGTLRSGALKKMDAVIDSVQEETFKKRKVRAWRIDETDIFLPEHNNDIIFVFTHIIKHFYHEGVGLRQISDWCRLLWTYKDSIDTFLLEKRIRSMGLMTEWRVFSSLAAQYLGMPVDAIPLYSDSTKWRRKAVRLFSFIIMTGNFGHNRDLSYSDNDSLIKRKTKSFLRHSSDAVKQFMIFPVDTFTVWRRMLVGGIKAII